MRKPYNKSTGRDYKSDYEKFQSSPEQIKNRTKRNKARAEAEKRGVVSKGDGKEVDHVGGIKSNKTRVVSRSDNRAKREKSRLKGSTRK
jgi:hypothetical protein